jgi:hypothetical protein
MHPVPKAVIIVDPPRRQWVRTLPCTICALTNAKQTSLTECAHVVTRRHGDHENLVPLCAEHHRTGETAWHRGRLTFQLTYGVVLEDVARRLHARYDKEQGWV